MKIFTEGQLVEKLTLHKVTPVCWLRLLGAAAKHGEALAVWFSEWSCGFECLREDTAGSCSSDPSSGPHGLG